MDLVTVYLRAPLFTFPHGAGHVPAGVMVIEGEVLEKVSGALMIATRKLLDDRGGLLAEKVITITVPWSKIDHVLAHGG